MLKNKLFLVLALVLLIIGGIVVLTTLENKSENLDGFTQCLKEKETILYGAFWCPHCQRQKELFGQSEKYLPYVECSTPDGKNQLSICKDKKITGYPTWEFKDGSRLEGEISLEKLSQKTGCKLPK